MLKDYKKILFSIKENSGGIVTILKDYSKSNDNFIYVLKTDLSKEYKIVESISLFNLVDYVDTIKEKTIIFLNYEPNHNNNLKYLFD